MPRPDFVELRTELLRSGISPGHVFRAITELDEHFEDLVCADIEDGCERVTAERNAMNALGDLAEVSRAMQQQPELKSWAWNYPRLARIVYPLACIAALPAVPRDRWRTKRLAAGALGRLPARRRLCDRPDVPGVATLYLAGLTRSQP